MKKKIIGNHTTLDKIRDCYRNFFFITKYGIQIEYKARLSLYTFYARLKLLCRLDILLPIINLFYIIFDVG